MKKEELVAFVSENADITKKSAGEAINAVLDLNSDIRIKQETVLPWKTLRLLVKIFRLRSPVYTWHKPDLW